MAAAAATAATAASESLLSQSLADRLDKRFQLYERRYGHKAPLAARAAFGDFTRKNRSFIIYSPGHQ